MTVVWRIHFIALILCHIAFASIAQVTTIQGQVVEYDGQSVGNGISGIEISYRLANNEKSRNPVPTDDNGDFTLRVIGVNIGKSIWIELETGVRREYVSLEQHPIEVIVGQEKRILIRLIKRAKIDEVKLLALRGKMEAVAYIRKLETELSIKKKTSSKDRVRIRELEHSKAQMQKKIASYERILSDPFSAIRLLRDLTDVGFDGAITDSVPFTFSSLTKKRDEILSRQRLNDSLEVLLEKNRSLSKNQVISFVNLSRSAVAAYARRLHFDSAALCLEELVKTGSASSADFVQLSKLSEFLGDYKRAIFSLRRALEFESEKYAMWENKKLRLELIKNLFEYHKRGVIHFADASKFIGIGDTLVEGLYNDEKQAHSLVIDYFTVVGGFFAQAFDFVKAEQYFDRAARLLTEGSPKVMQVISLYQNVLNLSIETRRSAEDQLIIAEALDSLLTLVDTNLIPEHREIIAYGYINLGTYFENNGNHYRAVSCFRHALFFRSMFYDFNRVDSLAYVGIVFNNLASSLNNVRSYDEALFYAKECVEVREVLYGYDSIRFVHQLANAHFSCGNVYLSLNKKDSAFYHLTMADTYFRKAISVNIDRAINELLRVSFSRFTILFSESPHVVDFERTNKVYLDLVSFLSSPRFNEKTQVRVALIRLEKMYGSWRAGLIF